MMATHCTTASLRADKRDQEVRVGQSCVRSANWGPGEASPCREGSWWGRVQTPALMFQGSGSLSPAQATVQAPSGTSPSHPHSQDVTSPWGRGRRGYSRCQDTTLPPCRLEHRAWGMVWGVQGATAL